MPSPVLNFVAVFGVCLCGGGILGNSPRPRGEACACAQEPLLSVLVGPAHPVCDVMCAEVDRGTVGTGAPSRKRPLRFEAGENPRQLYGIVPLLSFGVCVFPHAEFCGR